jgi:hypothetical protein
MLMEQLDYNLLFRGFVGLNMDDSTKTNPHAESDDSSDVGQRRSDSTGPGRDLSHIIHFSAACWELLL